MAIVFTEKPRRSLDIGADYKPAYVREFKALTDSKAIGPLAVANALGVWFGDPYTNGIESDPRAVVNRVRVREDGADDGKGWDLTLEYGQWEPKGDDLTEDLPEIELDFVSFDRIADKDAVSGAAITNSAGDPYDPPIVVDDHRLILTITQNQLAYDPLLADQVKNCTNNAAWTVGGITFPQYTALALPTRAAWAYRVNVGPYWRVTYQFMINGDTWKRKTLDQGPRYKSGSDVLQATTKDGYPMSTLLDGSGGRLASGGTPVFRENHVYKPIDFSVFVFPGITP